MTNHRFLRRVGARADRSRPETEGPAVIERPLVSKDNIHYVGVREALEDLGVMQILREAKSAPAPRLTVSWCEWRSRYDLATELLALLGEE